MTLFILDPTENLNKQFSARDAVSLNTVFSHSIVPLIKLNLIRPRDFILLDTNDFSWANGLEIEFRDAIPKYVRVLTTTNFNSDSMEYVGDPININKLFAIVLGEVKNNSEFIDPENRELTDFERVLQKYNPSQIGETTIIEPVKKLNTRIGLDDEIKKEILDSEPETSIDSKDTDVKPKPKPKPKPKAKAKAKPKTESVEPKPTSKPTEEIEIVSLDAVTEEKDTKPKKEIDKKPEVKPEVVKPVVKPEVKPEVKDEIEIISLDDLDAGTEKTQNKPKTPNKKKPKPVAKKETEKEEFTVLEIGEGFAADTNKELGGAKRAVMNDSDLLKKKSPRAPRGIPVTETDIPKLETIKDVDNSVENTEFTSFEQLINDMEMGE